MHTYSQSHVDVIRIQVVPLLEGFTDHPEASLHVRINLQRPNRRVSTGTSPSQPGTSPNQPGASPSLGMSAGICISHDPLPGGHAQTH